MQETLCKHCDHFIEENFVTGEILSKDITTITVKEGDDVSKYCRYVHCDDGRQEYDHDAEPGETKTYEQWGLERPDLLLKHPDGHIGPNSPYHGSRGIETNHNSKIDAFSDNFDSWAHDAMFEDSSNE